MQQPNLFTPDETNQPHLLSHWKKNMAMKVLILLLTVLHPLISWLKLIEVIIENNYQKNLLHELKIY